MLRHRAAIEGIVVTHLPEAAEAYLDIASDMRDREFRGRTANGEFLRHVGLLREEAAEVRAAMADDALGRLEVSTRALEAASGSTGVEDLLRISRMAGEDPADG
ncbi:hypothetical protein [Corynebacterium sp. 335C]